MLYCSGKTGHWHSVGDYSDVFWAAAAAAHHYMSRGRTGAVTRKQKLIVFTALHIHHRTIGFSVQLFQRSGMIFQEENEGEETIGF